jgi:hypothetical protein
MRAVLDCIVRRGTNVPGGKEKEGACYRPMSPVSSFVREITGAIREFDWSKVRTDSTR